MKLSLCALLAVLVTSASAFAPTSMRLHRAIKANSRYGTPSPTPLQPRTPAVTYLSAFPVLTPPLPAALARAPPLAVWPLYLIV